MKKRVAASAGERTRLACSLRRLAANRERVNELGTPVRTFFRSARRRHGAREARALPRVLVAIFLVIIGISAGIWLCLPKPPLMDDVTFSRRVFDRDGHQLRMTLSRDEK